MRTAPSLLRFALAVAFAFSSACATSRASAPDEGRRPAQSSSGHYHHPLASAGEAQRTGGPIIVSPSPHAEANGLTWVELLPVFIDRMPQGSLRLSHLAFTFHPDLERLRVEEIRPLRAAFDAAWPRAHPRLRLAPEFPAPADRGHGSAAAWEPKLSKEFFARYGPPLLTITEPLETSRLFLALRLSTRYMDDGIREAAEELFSAPAFMASVSLSILVYFAAWLAPEPLFSKAFAAALTVRLSLLVGLVELGRLADACLRLYRDSQAATTQRELEGAAERFGKALGGTGLRVLVVVASLGVPQVLPKVPQGGLWTLLSPLRHAPAGGPALTSITTAQIVADGSLVVTGVATGTAAVSICGELAACAMKDDGVGVSGATQLSTRYGKPHTRQNPLHNETIEQELARREAAGHADLRKNQPQVNARKIQVDDPIPVDGTRFRKPDVSSLRPDGVRQNTNYVSNPRDLRRELTAFDSMIRADPHAIHELYLLDGTLLRRYVPVGVSYP